MAKDHMNEVRRRRREQELWEAAYDRPEPEKLDHQLTPHEAAERAKRRYKATMEKQGGKRDSRKEVPFSDPEMWGIK